MNVAWRRRVIRILKPRSGTKVSVPDAVPASRFAQQMRYVLERVAVGNARSTSDTAKKLLMKYPVVPATMPAHVRERKNPNLWVRINRLLLQRQLSIYPGGKAGVRSLPFF